MVTRKILAAWNKVCPGCRIARKYPDSMIGKMVRAHWERGCPCHDAFVEVYGEEKPEGSMKPYQIESRET